MPRESKERDGFTGVVNVSIVATASMDLKVGKLKNDSDTNMSINATE
jgi:hypothetical protein